MKNKIKPYVEQKFISEQKHPNLDLWIYNYTKRCQYEKKWDEVTTMCRGLILNKEGNIIARPFKKFFNIGEHLNEITLQQENEIIRLSKRINPYASKYGKKKTYSIREIVKITEISHTTVERVLKK